MKKFLRKHWLSLLGLLFGLISIVLAIIIYTLTLASREPVFVVDPNRTEIIRADRVSDAPLKVVRAEGSEISGDISSVRVYLWNRGSISIKPEHILEPLMITLDDPEGEILDFRILERSREVVAPEVVRFPKDSKRVLFVDFKILEQGDGFCLQIIFVGSSSTDILIDGVVEGVSYPIGALQVEKSRFWVVYLNKIKWFGMAMIFIIVVVGGAIMLSSLPDYLKNKPGRAFEILSTCVVWGTRIVKVAAIPYLIWALILKPVKEAEKEARQSIVESVPLSIVPHQGSSEIPNN